LTACQFNSYFGGKTQWVYHGITYTSLGAWQSDTGFDQSFESKRSITDDPQFVDLLGHDYRLKNSSPCRDVGVNIQDLTDDIIGSSRPEGVGFDMGAYEGYGLNSPKNLRTSAM